MTSTGLVTAAVGVPVAELSCALPGATVTFLTWVGVPDEGLDRELATYFGAQVGFSYTLCEVNEFPDGTAYVAPEPASDFRRLSQHLHQRFREHTPLTHFGPDLIPHLALPEAPTLRQAVLDRMPLQCHAQEAVLRSPDGIVVGCYPFATSAA